MAKKRKMGWKDRLLLCIMMLTSIAALPTTVILFVGMLPTIVSRFTDKRKNKTRVLTVGFLNFAACFPSWFQLMHKEHTFAHAVEIISDPLTIVIMYSGALMGYMIEWALSGFVGAIMVSRGRKRLHDIAKMQSDLIARWGPEVAGDIPLNPDGFPIESSK